MPYNGCVLENVRLRVHQTERIRVAFRTSSGVERRHRLRPKLAIHQGGGLVARGWWASLDPSGVAAAAFPGREREG